MGGAVNCRFPSARISTLALSPYLNPPALHRSNASDWPCLRCFDPDLELHLALIPMLSLLLSPIRPNRIAWLATDRLAMLALLDPELELYLALDPLTDEALAMQVAEGLRRHLGDKKVQADLLL